jgi:hypothetical protein
VTSHPCCIIRPIQMWVQEIALWMKRPEFRV